MRYISVSHLMMSIAFMLQLFFHFQKKKFHIITASKHSATQRLLALPIQLVALSKKFKNRFCVATLIARRATTFTKVLIARRATTFGKVDYSDYQLLLQYVIQKRFVNTHINKTFQTPSTELLNANAVTFSHLYLIFHNYLLLLHFKNKEIFVIMI